MNLKVKIGLSAVLAIVFAVCAYLITLFIIPESAVLLALLTASLSYLMFLAFFVLYDRWLNARYRKLEKLITSPIFYKANGNFALGNGKIKNGNMYFCEDGIVCIGLEEKPYTLDQIALRDIREFEHDNTHLIIHTKDTRLFVITSPDVSGILQAVKQKGWIT